MYTKNIKAKTNTTLELLQGEQVLVDQCEEITKDKLQLLETLSDSAIMIQDAIGLHTLVLGGVLSTRRHLGQRVNARWLMNSNHPLANKRELEFADKVDGIAFRADAVEVGERFDFKLLHGETFAGMSVFTEIGSLLVQKMAPPTAIKNPAMGGMIGA